MSFHYLDAPIRLYSHGDQEDRYIVTCFCGFRSRPCRTEELAKRAGLAHVNDKAAVNR